MRVYRALEYARGVKPSLYLTFDDGPHPANTPAILDVLRAHGAFATFFQEGRFVDRYPELTERVASEGHTVGNHTQDHVRLSERTPGVVRQQLADTSDAIERVTGRRPTVFRAPFLDIGTGVVARMISAVARELGMTVVECDVDAEDYTPGSTRESIFRRVVSEARPGAVVMLHDDIDTTVSAVEALVCELSGGYSLEALPANYDARLRRASG
jgi:peptidoglycan/xylan/chitin deacetylase (PgdA/CDA1 family)